MRSNPSSVVTHNKVAVNKNMVYNKQVGKYNVISKASMNKYRDDNVHTNMKELVCCG